ncbi:aldose 1-epimerase family protein [Anaeromicropila herbilytica]|uniref:Aldose 1-epimerase n=1 Tax=Anaeromicropila herbilytica TaxID=2785025 RepID=A0A7R7ID48_9FIRM|nr:aldose 1-epimerase family protein [Anaeromicropila herbilytica]BCN30531.1 aldose 1-epimerase [Anaeromicropila herbilytica]
MAKNMLKNEELTITIDNFGAELSSIKDTKTGVEYLWNADETYWKRHSPVLFPIVGSLKDKQYSYNNNVYSMSQHGFARDKSMDIVKKEENEIWFQLVADEETKRAYPFDFTLEIGYRLQGRKISVLWKVINTGEEKMYFQIGAHPAFLCPIRENEKQTDYKIDFHTEEELTYKLLSKDGLLEAKEYELSTVEGVLQVTNHLFDKDALVIEKPYTNRISLKTPENKDYVTVHFDAPVVGIWSPAGRCAPFICIEPWYGRCDASDFNGTLEEREWINELSEKEEFQASYEIEIGKLD